MEMPCNVYQYSDMIHLVNLCSLGLVAIHF